MTARALPRTVLPLLLPMTLALGVAMSSSARAADSEQGLATADRAELIELLERSQAETLRLVADLDAAAWKERPAADRWSIGEVVEHLVLAEGAVRGRVVALLEGGPAEFPVPADAKRPPLAELVALGIDRNQKFQAPEAIQPQSPRSQAEVLRDFMEERAESIAFVLETTGPLRAVAAPSPIGQVLDGSGWLALLGGHNLRHNLQIIEVREQLGLAAVE